MSKKPAKPETEQDEAPAVEHDRPEDFKQLQDRCTREVIEEPKGK